MSMDQQAQQQINQFKVIALQAAAGDLTNAKKVFDWLTTDYKDEVIAQLVVAQQAMEATTLATGVPS